MTEGLGGDASLPERIVKLAPDRLDMRWCRIDTYQMTSDVDAENRQWCEVLRRDPRNVIATWWYPPFRKSHYPEERDT